MLRADRFDLADVMTTVHQLKLSPLLHAQRAQYRMRHSPSSTQHSLTFFDQRREYGKRLFNGGCQVRATRRDTLRRRPHRSRRLPSTWEVTDAGDSQLHQSLRQRRRLFGWRALSQAFIEDVACPLVGE